MLLSSYACCSKESAGRLFRERKDKVDDCFLVDRGRVINSRAYLSLSYKSFTLPISLSSSIGTAILHTIKAVQITHDICYSLGLNSILGETVAMIMGIGGAPFGWHGNRILNLSLQKLMGIDFDRRIQALRMICMLESGYGEFDGLNLTKEVIMGVLGDCSTLTDSNPQLKPIVDRFAKAGWSMPACKYTYGEGQAADVGMKIQYTCGIIADAFLSKMLTFEHLLQIPFYGTIVQQLQREYSQLSEHEVFFRALLKLSNKMTNDVVRQSIANIAQYNIATKEDMMKGRVVHMSSDMEAISHNIMAYIADSIDASFVDKIKDSLSGLLELYYKRPKKMLSQDWQTMYSLAMSDKEAALVVCDAISYMTDNDATSEYIAHMEPV